MADGLGDIFVGLDDFRKFSADSFLQNANRLIGDVWTQHTIDNIPQMAGDIWTQHVTSQLPNLTSMLAPPAAPPPPQTAPAAPPDPFASPTPPTTTPTIPTAPAPLPGAGSGTPPPSTPPAPAAGVPGPVTETTAGLSGGGQGTGNMTDRAQGILAGGAQAASWLGDQGQRALQAVLVTEGGLNNARGDQGKSAGPLQFYEGGQLANLAQQLGMSLEQAKSWVEQNPVEAIKWAIGTPDKPGYLGGAIQRGLQAGLSGADLATYAQRHGQVSVSPERAGQNFNALFGTGQDLLGGAGQAVQSVASTVGGAVDTAKQFAGNLVPNQFGDPQLTAGEAAAACGPAAAIAFARANGRNPTLREAVDLARQVGFTESGGMNGIANQKALLDKMGIASTLDPNPTWDKIAADAGSGNPVAISTPRHYFVADGFDPQTGKYHVGASGTAFKAGAEWMTAEQIANLGGGVNGALFADHPASPQPSVAVADQQAQKPVQNALSQLGAPTDQQAASTGQPQSLWDRLGGGISDVFKNVFGGGGSSSTPPPPPEGGGYGAVPPGGQNPLDQIGQGISNAASNVLSQVNLTDPTRSVIGGNPVAPATMPTSTELIQHAEEQKNRAIEENNPLRDVPLIGGLTTGAAQAVDPLMFAAGPVLGTAAKALPVGTGLAGTLARGAVQGAGFGAIQGATQPEADIGSTLRGAAIGAGLGAAGEGGLAALEGLRPPTVARASTGIPTEGELAQRAGNINLAKYPTEVQDVIQAAAPTIPETATRGVVPDAVVRDLAQKAGTTVQDVVAKWQPGQAQNAETLYALRDALANQGRSVLDAQQALRSNPGSADAQAALVQALTEHRAVQEVVQGTTAEAGRALRQFTQPVTGDIAALQQLQTLAAKTGQSPDDLAQRLATMDLSDPVHMGDIAKALNPPRLPPNEALGPAGPQPGQFQFGSELPVGGPRPTGTEPLARGPQPGQFQLESELPLGGPRPTGREALGPSGRQPGQLGLGVGEQFQQDLMADVPGVAPQRVAPPEAPAARPARETSPDPTGLRNFFGEAGTGKALGDSLVKHELAQAETRMAALRAKHPEITDEQAAQTPLGQQIERYRAEARARGIEAGAPSEPQPPESAAAAQASPGGFEMPNVPTSAQTPEQADYLRRALTLKALREGTPLPDIPYQGPRGTNLQPNFDPSRAFDYDKLAQLRQDVESRQPQLDLNAPPKPNRVDKVISYTVNNMLSGVGTQIQNIMGNLSATVSRPLVTAAGGVTGDAGLFVDAARDVAAMGATFSEAFSRAGQTLKTGVRSGQPEQLATSAFAPQLRLLSAGDEFFRTLNAAGGQAAEVSRLLRENPSLSFEETLAKYQGRILAAGEDAAARSVYEKGGIGWGESIAQARNQLLRSDDPAKKALGVILNATVPFSKVPDTILTLGVRGLPGVNEVYGIGKTVNLLRQGEVYAARREAGATALLTAANLGILAQALQGNITGDGPDDPTLLSQMMAARDQNGNALWRPHSVKLPDGRWIDYGFLGPMELHMAAIANVVEGAREQGGSINPQPAQMTINRLTKTVGNLWYLRGLSDVLSAINGGQLATPNVANSIEAIGDRFVWQGGLLNEIRQLTDPTVRDPQDPLSREANRIPGLEALVPARPDPTTGQPLQRPQDVLSIMSRGSPPGMSPGSGSAEILSRSDVAVSPAPKQITVGKFPIQLTHDEQQQYTTLRGQLIDQMVAPLARDNAFQTAPLYVREQVLRKMLDQASSAASKMMIGQIDPNSLNQRLQQSQQIITTNTPFLPEDTSTTGRVPALAR